MITLTYAFVFLLIIKKISCFHVITMLFKFIQIHWVPLTASSAITSTQLQRVDFSHVQIFLSLTPVLNKFGYNEYRLQQAEFCECNCSL